MKLVLTIAEVREIVARKYGIKGDDFELDIDYSYYPETEENPIVETPTPDCTGFSKRLLQLLFDKGYINSVDTIGHPFNDTAAQIMKEINDFYYANGFGILSIVGMKFIIENWGAFVTYCNRYGLPDAEMINKKTWPVRLY